MNKSSRHFLLLTVAVVVAGLVGAGAGVRADGPSPRQAFRTQLRDLLVDQNVYTRGLVISTIGGLPDVDATARALQDNQDQLAAAFAPYYGGPKTHRLEVLLHTYTTDLRSMLRAVRAGVGVDPARAQLDGASNALADVLNGWNQTNWSHDALAGHFRGHAVAVQLEAQARLRGDWAGDLSNVTADRSALMQLADLMTQGVFLQFPDRFVGGAAATD